MKRANVYSLAGMLLAVGLLVGCGVSADSQEGQMQIKTSQTLPSALTDSSDQPTLATSAQELNAETNLESDSVDLLSCGYVDWEITLCKPLSKFKFICTHTGTGTSCCVAPCRSHCQTTCGYSAATCKSLCVF